jgi:hypothetical protein
MFLLYWVRIWSWVLRLKRLKTSSNIRTIRDKDHSGTKFSKQIWKRAPKKSSKSGENQAHIIHDYLWLKHWLILRQQHSKMLLKYEKHSVKQAEYIQWSSNLKLDWKNELKSFNCSVFKFGFEGPKSKKENKKNVLLCCLRILSHVSKIKH